MARRGRPGSADGLSVNELILAFYKHAEIRYGNGSKELTQFRYSLRALKELYGTEPAAAFGPRCLRAVRQRMIDAGLSRGVVNRRVARIKTVFSWGVAEELILPSITHAAPARSRGCIGAKWACARAPLSCRPSRPTC